MFCRNNGYSQSVSCWENDVCYPDMDLLPAIANFFGVSIDKLFGCGDDGEKQIDAIIARIDAYGIQARGDDEWVDECLAILRDGLARFPGNERLRITLAETLWQAGWRRHRAWTYYDDEGYIRHDYDTQRKNPYWDESITICEQLTENAADHSVRTRAISILVPLYRNIGENEKMAAKTVEILQVKTVAKHRRLWYNDLRRSRSSGCCPAAGTTRRCTATGNNRPERKADRQ